VEKQITTPDYYPLTLNALVNGCNQTTSRDPVVSYDDTVVTRALNGLRDKKLAYVFSGADSRVVKFGHKLPERLELSAPETAILCLLLLRGPQTAGEIRNRSGRLYEFSSLADAEATLEGLAARQPQPPIVRMPRQPGAKESRFAHTLGCPTVPSSPAPSQPPSAVPPSPAVSERVAQLETEATALRGEISELRQQLADFKRQFE
jgi:uncharacterized protein YceH (UPF0502 family)